MSRVSHAPGSWLPSSGDTGHVVTVHHGGLHCVCDSHRHLNRVVSVIVGVSTAGLPPRASTLGGTPTCD